MPGLLSTLHVIKRKGQAMLGELLFGAGILLPVGTPETTKALDALGKLGSREDLADNEKTAIADALHALLYILSSPKVVCKHTLDTQDVLCAHKCGTTQPCQRCV